jgi:hypothetical protein
MTNELVGHPGYVLTCGCYLRPDKAEPRFWFCKAHGEGHAHSDVVEALQRLAHEPAARYEVAKMNGVVLYLDGEVLYRRLPENRSEQR